MSKKSLDLLPPESLIKTGDVDHADWNYRLMFGSLLRSRYNLVTFFLGNTKVKRLLEIGYGSGVFLTELTKYCDELYGVDKHEYVKEVAEKLSEFDVYPQLSSAEAEKMPFEENFFDIIVTVSTLEFVGNLELVCSEISKILQPDGKLIVITPGKSFITDFGLKVLTGKDADEDFGNRREIILPTLQKHFEIIRESTVPSYGASLLRLYSGLEMKRKI